MRRFAAVSDGFKQERLKSPAYYFLLTLWVEASWNLSDTWCENLCCSMIPVVA